MKTKLWLFAIFIVFGLMFTIASPVISAVVSTNREFNATQDSIFLNYTNGYSQNITLWSNASYDVFLNISNSSTSIAANYSQVNSNFYCQQHNIGFLAKNAGNAAVNQVNISAVGNNTNLTIVFSTLSCLPGRYWGGFTIMNKTNATENLTINVDIHNPISASADGFTSLRQTGIGGMSAAIPGNVSAFHRYYFNTSELNRSTTVTINMSATQDLDLFLFDNSNPARLLARSANKSNSSEWLTYWQLAPNSMYEIRIFGNITNATLTAYSFYTLFSTLNATYTADSGQPASTLSFGSLNTSMRNIQNITLRNEGNISMDSVNESKEFYQIKRWTKNNSASATGFDGMFLVPSFATKIKVAVNWTDTAQNYTIYLTAPNKTVIGYSNDRYANANATNASLEEYFETTAITQGYWNVSVRNATASYSNYTLSALVWYPASDWIVTNYSTRTFNTTGNNNSNTSISINFTASNNSIDGSYEGFLQYTTAQGAALRIPFSASVNASTLVVNNTIGSATLQIDENIGANLTKNMSVTLNNTGSYPLSFALENSINNSNALWYGTSFINFTYQAPSSPLLAGENHLLNITFYLDPNTTRNNTGVYEGYIKFVTNDSRPYQNFTLTLRVNLTNDLNVVISEMRSVDNDLNWINQTGSAENFTAKLDVYYINETVAANKIISLNTTNFTSVWLTSANLSYRIPISGSLNIFNGTNPIYTSNYNLNITVPANQPGGIYQLHVAANYSRSDNLNFKGEGVYNYLYINNTGLSMSTANLTSIEIANTSSKVFAVNVSNYGNIAGSSATIQLSESCSGYSAAVTSGGSTGCTLASGSTDIWTVTVPANSNTCMVWWTITAGSAAAGACNANIIGAGAGNTWYDTRGINVSVTVTAPSPSTTPSTTPSTSPGTTPNTTTTPASELTITAFPAETKIVQNASASVSISVKNSGAVNLTGVKLYVDGINQSWYAQPAAQDIGKTVEKNYSIAFNIPASAPVASYSIKYVANNSAATKSASASLLVLPSNQTAIQISTNISDYAQKYRQISLLLNDTKARGANLTEAESALKKAKELIDKADAYIKAGDYFNAHQLAGQIDDLLKIAEAKIDEAKQILERQAGNVWIWAVIGLAVVIIAGFVAYLMMPPKKGFTAERGYQYGRPEVKKTGVALAKEKLNNILGKMKRKQGFSQPANQSFAYNGTASKTAAIRRKLGSIKEKIKGKFRKKQKPQPSQPQPFVYKGPPLEE